MARIFAVTRHELTELATLRASDEGHGHIHHRAGTPGSGHEPVSEDFMRRVASALHEPAEVLIAGPAQAKQAFKAYLAAKMPALSQRVVAVEALNHANDGELHDFARRFFYRIHRMRG
jgi:stalled ribosome rescue protein Dom34